MLDTQDAQVMPLICKKHLCGATVAEACGDAAEWTGLWILGVPPAWTDTSCVDTGVPAAVCTVELAALWFPETFARIKCQKSFKLEG